MTNTMNLLEIDNKNCILSMYELEKIGLIFNLFLREKEGDGNMEVHLKRYVDMLFLKICKLNDMAKNKKIKEREAKDDNK